MIKANWPVDIGIIADPYKDAGEHTQVCVK